ncbi:hypothetical protein APHAL10511_003239 [Amanita phalloides]|nr:hypothetical protein APHAL10511_003239 [Amanita phalloides]
MGSATVGGGTGVTAGTSGRDGSGRNVSSGGGQVFEGRGQPMDLDRSRGRAFPRQCFNCKATTHLAKNCPTRAIRSAWEQSDNDGKRFIASELRHMIEAPGEHDMHLGKNESEDTARNKGDEDQGTSPQCNTSSKTRIYSSCVLPEARAPPTSSCADPRRGTIHWVYAQLAKGPSVALHALYRWSHRQRRSELTTALVQELRSLPPDDAYLALRELKKPRRWIRRVGQISVLIPALSTTVTDQCSFDISALLDCGATGCYLDEGFAHAKGLFLERLPRAVPVYNADGSFNAGGPIRFLTTLRVQIHEHSEVITFAITNLGKSDMILGFDWLRKHNPTVDWKTVPQLLLLLLPPSWKRVIVFGLPRSIQTQSYLPSMLPMSARFEQLNRR